MNIKLITALSASMFLLIGCSSYQVDESVARERLYSIISEQKEEDFRLITKGSVLKKRRAEKIDIYHGVTTNVNERENILIALDLDEYYFHYSYVNGVNSLLNEEHVIFLEDGVLYVSKENIEGKKFLALENLSGQEIEDYILKASKEANFFEYELGDEYLAECYKLLDIYQNGVDAYRDTLLVGSEVKTFDFSFASTDPTSLDVNSILESEYDLNKDDNHGLDYLYNKEEISFKNNILSSVYKNSVSDKKFYYGNDLITSNTFNEVEEINFYNSYDLYIPSLEGFEQVDHF